MVVLIGYCGLSGERSKVFYDSLTHTIKIKNTNILMTCTDARHAVQMAKRNLVDFSTEK